MKNLGLSNGHVQQTGICLKTWDAVCSDFETLNLNWNPSLRPTTAIKHWSWSKPSAATTDLKGELMRLPVGAPEHRLTPATSIRYRLDARSESATPNEVWILLSQHIVNTERTVDDIALHVQEEGPGQTTSKLQTITGLVRIEPSFLSRQTLTPSVRIAMLSMSL